MSLENAVGEEDARLHDIALSTVRVKAVTQAVEHAKRAEQIHLDTTRAVTEARLTRSELIDSSSLIASECRIGLLWAAIAEAAKD